MEPTSSSALEKKKKNPSQTAAIRFKKCSVSLTFAGSERSLEIEISFKSESWSEWEHNYIRGSTRTNTSARRNSSLKAFGMHLRPNRIRYFSLTDGRRSPWATLGDGAMGGSTGGPRVGLPVRPGNQSQEASERWRGFIASVLRSRASPALA